LRDPPSRGSCPDSDYPKAAIRGCREGAVCIKQLVMQRFSEEALLAIHPRSSGRGILAFSCKLGFSEFWLAGSFFTWVYD